MFAGKTTEMVRRLLDAQRRGLSVLAIKPARDTRYRVMEIATHTGETFPAVPVADAGGVIGACGSLIQDSKDRTLPPTPSLREGASESARGGDAAGGMAQVVAIDEVHFFGAALTPVCLELIRRGVRVILAGVERDHRGVPFEPFPYLLCEADEVVKLSGKCAVCGGPSVHSQRMIASDAAIVVGGAEAYQARCRECFEPGR
jgi:thymidine kinase